MSFWSGLLLAMIGLGWGVAVGSGFVAFITVLDLIPRLTQLTNSRRHIRKLEWALICGVVFFTLVDFYGWQTALPRLAASVYGLFSGVFVGTLAAGLTEALNVFPIIAKRLQMEDKLLYLLMAMVLGKIAGSLVQWLLAL
ncbi:stage V sporulation protein AB [Brevibacillus sp. TJ4]|uniref:stage V sporulation protein AB n=1 Tax=Brevibacillus sp. TJ4 TaxID=3234853 RepID=UPI0037D24636